mgnify:CR=1 FL=1
MATLLTEVFILLQDNGGKEMMAMLWAQQIMLGKKTYDQVPRLLKEKVKEILIDSGIGELAGEGKQEERTEVPEEQKAEA